MGNNQNGAKKNRNYEPKLGSATHEKSGLIFVNLDYKEREIAGIKVPGSDFHTLLRKTKDDSEKRMEGPFVVIEEEDVPDPRVKAMVDELKEKGALFFSASTERRIVFKMAYKVPVSRHYKVAGGIDVRTEKCEK
jgi:hypothetical protein